MSAEVDLARLSVREFAERFKAEMIPLSNKFSYFFVALSLSEEDIREHLQEPIAALPPAIVSVLPQVSVLLVPYIEKPNGKGAKTHHTEEDVILLEKPAENRSLQFSILQWEDQAVLAFAMKGLDVADYHYYFYSAVSQVTAGRCSAEAQTEYALLLREELGARVHGEVDEASWHEKQALLRRQTNVRRETKAFRDYAQRSFVDTLTLYLHGICCDIDVETGPRQLPSRYLRKRLMLLESQFPPPSGYAVFPEELKELEK